MFLLLLSPLLTSVVFVNADFITYCNDTIWHEGDRATITCYFSDDVSKTKRHFKVQKKKFDEEWEADSDVVLDCTYPKDAQDFHCNSAPGYQLEGSISSEVTVAIASYGDDYAGTYLCQLVRPDPHESHSCNVTTAGTGSSVLDSVGAIIGIAVATLFGLVLIIALGYFVWKYCSCTKSTNGNTRTPEETELPNTRKQEYTSVSQNDAAYVIPKNNTDDKKQTLGIS